MRAVSSNLTNRWSELFQRAEALDQTLAQCRLSASKMRSCTTAERRTGVQAHDRAGINGLQIAAMRPPVWTASAGLYRTNPLPKVAVEQTNSAETKPIRAVKRCELRASAHSGPFGQRIEREADQ